MSISFLISNTDFLFLFRYQFVAHPNVQQLLASIWYEGKYSLSISRCSDSRFVYQIQIFIRNVTISGLPGFRRKNMALQALEIVRIGNNKHQQILYHPLLSSSATSTSP